MYSNQLNETFDIFNTEDELSPSRVVVHGTTRVNVSDNGNQRLTPGISWHPGDKYG